MTPALAISPGMPLSFRLLSGFLKSLPRHTFGNGQYFVSATSVTHMDTQAQINLYVTLTRELGLSEREIMAHLPPMLGGIAREIGLAITLKLVAHTRGKQIYLPDVVTEDCRIAQIIGAEAATAVINLVGGSQHIVVSNPFNTRFIVRRKAVKALRQGWSINEVASHFGVSFNTVRTWRKKAGISGQLRGNNNPQKQIVMEKLSRGESVLAISHSTGVNSSTIRTWKFREGLAA